MTHNPDKPMKESDGEFTSAGTATRYCLNCKEKTLHTELTWESSCGGYEDYKYECSHCHTVHWVDGIDS